MTIPTYRCYNCGTMISMQPCFQCENMKNLRRAADAQEEANRRAERESRVRERERERSRYEAEREAYYERQRRREAEIEADPEYQERLARRREEKARLEEEKLIRENNEFWIDFNRREQEILAETQEKARWDALTPQQQAAEIELKSLREAVIKARFNLYLLFKEKPEGGSVNFGSFGSGPQAVLDEIAKIKDEIAIIEVQTDLLRKQAELKNLEENERLKTKIKNTLIVIAAMIAYTILHVYIKT